MGKRYRIVNVTRAPEDSFSPDTVFVTVSEAVDALTRKGYDYSLNDMDEMRHRGPARAVFTRKAWKLLTT